MAMEFKDAFDPMRALRHGYEMLRREPAPVLVGGFVMFVLNACQGQGNQVRLPNSGGDPWSGGEDPFGGGNPFEGFDEAMLGVVLLLLGVACCVGLFVFAIKSFVEPGTWRVGERITMDGAAGLDTLFSGKDAWLPMMGYKLLTGIISLGVFTVFALPGGLVAGAAIAMDRHDPNVPLIVAGVFLVMLLALPAVIYVALGLQLGNYAISIDRLGTMEALDRSWSLARGNRLRLFWFNFMSGLLALAAAIAGMLMCCIGLVVTVPAATGIIFCAQANAYLLFTREDFEDFALVKEIGAL